MRRITIPKTVKLAVPTGEPEPGGHRSKLGAPFDWPFVDYLRDHVFVLPPWRSGDKNAFEAWCECSEVFHGALKEGDVVDVSDEAYEILLPMAMQQGVQLAPHIADVIKPYARAVLYAERVAVKPPKDKGD